MPVNSSNRTAWIVGGVAAVLIAAIAFAVQNNNGGSDLALNVPKPDPTIEVPAGTAVAVKLQTSLSTKTTHVGDHFDAVVNSPVLVNGTVAIPAGADISGHVVLAEQPGKTSGRGALQLAYDQVSFEGESYDLGTRGRQYQSESGKGKDAKLIGGGAVAGGLVGGILGGSAGDAAKGALIGGAAGGAASLMTRGPHLELPQGTVLTVRLDVPLTVNKPKAA